MICANGGMRLADVEQRLAETTQDTLNWQSQMRSVVANSISAEDVQAIIAKQVARAKEGDATAAKFVLTHVLGSGTPITLKQTNIITDPATAAKLARQAG